MQKTYVKVYFQKSRNRNKEGRKSRFRESPIDFEKLIPLDLGESLKAQDLLTVQSAIICSPSDSDPETGYAQAVTRLLKIIMRIVFYNF